MVPIIQKICTKYRGEYHVFAAGERDYRTKININIQYPTSSSLLDLSFEHKSLLSDQDITIIKGEQTVHVRPLDSIFNENYEGPYLLKIDTEGYDLSVIKGANKILTKTEIIVSEINVRERFTDSYEFCDFIAAMENHQFHLFDIVNLGQYGKDGPLLYLDAVFVKEGSNLWLHNKT